MSKCWYCNNELTSGDSPKHFGICNKCYDEMFKSSDTIISSFTNKISDLEAKLAEKDKEIERLKSARNCTQKQVEIWKHEFALEQLEKVKSRYPRGTTMWTSNITEDGFEYVSDYIDNQIKELKEEIKNE